MKKLIIFTMLLILSATSFSQQTNPSQALTRADYLQKSKKQKTTAWILLGGGAGLATAGFIIGNSSTSFDDNKLTTGALLIIAGGVAMVGSIPFFISAGSNKRKAEIMLKNESNSSLRLLHNRRNFIALSVKIPL